MIFPKLDTVALVMPAYCSKTGKMYGIRTEQIGPDEWVQTWTFELSEATARQEKFDGTQINGKIYMSDSYKGCPHCGAKGWYRCNSCGAIGCLGETDETATCPKCHEYLTGFTPVDTWSDLKGGDY